MIRKILTPLYLKLYVIGVLAAKDIVDALKNKMVISLIAMSSIVLLVPKLLPLIFEQPKTVIPMYAQGNSRVLETFGNDANITVQEVSSERELSAALCGAAFPLIGLILPANHDQNIANNEPLILQGYICWGRRYQAANLVSPLQAKLSQTLGRPVTINLKGNIVYPPSGMLLLNITTLNSVLMILMIGITLIPSLLLEEKESKTIQALLVSPASISQVVFGKALAGLFYILVTAAVIYGFSWAEVIHWDIAIIFTVCGAIFSASIGLLLGSLFDKQQDIVGWMTLLLLIQIGAVLLHSLNMELPVVINQVLPWIPSVALANICRMVFSETITVSKILFDIVVITIFTVPIYAIVVWRLRLSDR